QRRLEVMAAPDAGAFGVAVACVTMLIRWSALVALSPSVPLLAGLWCASRAAMAVIVLAQPYVGGGLATAFLPDDDERLPLTLIAGAGGMALSLVLLVLWKPWAGATALTTAVLTAAGVAGFARRRVGGYTGDVLGAVAVMAETVGLLVAAAK